MEAILKFNLPDEEVKFEQAINGEKVHLILWEIDNFLRNKIKYGNNYKNVDEALEDIRSTLNSMIQDENISFD